MPKDRCLRGERRLNTLGPVPIDTDDSASLVVELIYRLKVRDVMTREIVTCTPDHSIRHAQELMREHGISGVPVVRSRRLVGIISMDDVIRALDGNYIDEALVERMTRNVIVLEDDMPLGFAISYLEKYRFGRFPVIDAAKHLVGILTSRDIIIALLVEINREVTRLERNQPTNEITEEGFRLEYATRSFDFETAGRLSTETKRRLTEAGVPRAETRRVAVATYELEMNQVVHSQGGRVTVVFDSASGLVTISAVDTGPGITDIDAALTEGFSTANDWIRSLGFGAGMGLPNTRRVSDSFEIESSASGTAVRVTIKTGGKGDAS